MQAKRIQVNEANIGAGGSIEAILTPPASPREQINFHNIWLGVAVEPQNAGANCQGTWVLYIVKAGAGFLGFTDANVNAEGRNQEIVACGVFASSNEASWTMPPTQIKTSRNLNPGESLRLQCTVTGITAGVASSRVMLCAHTVRA